MNNVEISAQLAATHGKAICEPCGGRCCRFCGTHRGYFDTDWEFQQAKRRYGFDAGTYQPGPRTNGLGFLGEYGCKIPREERSATCIQYWCSDVVSKMSPQEINLVRKTWI